MDVKLMEYELQGQTIKLELSENVFKPSPHGTVAIGRAMRINSGETVLDIGTGTGLLAILAAKLGGKVTAVDLVPDALKLAKKNATENNVSLDIRGGDLFSSVDGNIYDVIIANVPQENLSPKVINAMSHKKVVSMSGGERGGEMLVKILEDAPSFMHQNSRLYIVIYSLSNFRESFKKLHNYNARLLDFYSSPVKDFVYSDPVYYELQNEKGDISIYKNNDEYWADIFVFELRLK